MQKLSNRDEPFESILKDLFCLISLYVMGLKKLFRKVFLQLLKIFFCFNELYKTCV
jgi:hypothetical protein